ncbi:MAG: hypothetical protein V3T88_07040 [Nitrosomonadaceae bacterium]
MDDQLEPPPRGINLFSTQWRDWLFRLYRFVLSMGNKDFYFEVSRGSVRGHSPVNKFGSNPSVGTTESVIWTFGPTLQQLTYSTTGDIDTLSSSNAGDTQEVSVLGLDGNFERISQTVTLNGQTKVTLATPLIRVHNMRNIGATSFVGNIHLYVDGAITAGVPDVASTVRGYITNGDNQSLSATYSVPVNTTAFIIFGKTSVASGKDVVIKFYGRAFGSVFAVEHVVDVNAENYDYFFKIPLKMPAKSDLEVRAITAASTAEVSAAFDIVLVED